MKITDFLILIFAFLTLLATLAQLVFSYRVWALQISNEAIAKRIEILVRFNELGGGPISGIAWLLTVSNLSTFGVWVDFVTVRVKDVENGKPFEKTVYVDAVMPGGGFVQREVRGFPKQFEVVNYGISVRARGKHTIVVTNQGGMVSIEEASASLFSWLKSRPAS
jgi:hypothetical protein